MSLLHVTLTRDRALVVTDDTSYRLDPQNQSRADVIYWPNGAHVAVQKLYPLPHLNLLLAHVGADSVADFAIGNLHYADAGNFGQAVAQLANVLPSLIGEPALQGTFKGRPLRQSVYLIGWDTAHKAMCIATFCSETAYRAEVAVMPEGRTRMITSPFIRKPDWLNDTRRRAEARAWLEAEHKRQPRCLESAEAYALEALRQERLADPGAPFGGRLVLAEVTRRGVNIVYGADAGLPERRTGADDLRKVGELVLCIGSPPLVQTDGLEEEAATETFADETGADDTSIGGGGGSSFVTCAARSYENTTDRAVVVQWDAEIVGLHFSAGATLASPDDYVVAQVVCEINSTPVLTDPLVDSSADLVPPEAGNKLSRTSSWQRVVDPGDTIELSIVAGGATDANAATISWARTRLRTSVIKV